MKKFKISRKCDLYGYLSEGIGEDIIEAKNLKELKEFLKHRYTPTISMKIVKVTEFELEDNPNFYGDYTIEEIKE